MITDPIADLLTRIRNAQNAGHHTARIRKSKMAERVLKVLQAEGFIGAIETREDSTFGEYEVNLKYFGEGDPAIRTARRYSSPGCRKYVRHSDVPKVESGLGIAILSTSQGVLSDREARKRGIGGEVLALIS